MAKRRNKDQPTGTLTPKQRQRKMAQEVQRGCTPAEVARKYGVSSGTVETACREHGVPCNSGRMTMAARQERRENIARDVAAGHNIAEIVRRYKVSLTTIEMSCRERGVNTKRIHLETGPSKVRVNEEVLRIIVQLIEGRSGPEIAEEFEVTRQYVHQVRRLARRVGIFSAITKLGKANPDKPRRKPATK